MYKTIHIFRVNFQALIFRRIHYFINFRLIHEYIGSKYKQCSTITHNLTSIHFYQFSAGPRQLWPITINSHHLRYWHSLSLLLQTKYYSVVNVRTVISEPPSAGRRVQKGCKPRVSEEPAQCVWILITLGWCSERKQLQAEIVSPLLQK